MWMLIVFLDYQLYDCVKNKSIGEFFAIMI